MASPDMYYMLVLPSDMYLDNYAISIDDADVAFKHKRLNGEPPLLKGLQVTTLGKIWEIAVHGEDEDKEIEDQMKSLAGDLF